MIELMTFNDLEQLTGTAYPVVVDGDKWPLEEWYDAVRQLPIIELSVEDLAKACRQGIWIEHVLPVALEALKRNPQAGELYDGELVVALKSIPAEFWSQHRELTADIISVIGSALDDFDTDVRSDAAQLLAQLKTVGNR